jgi:hypothetical protein
MAQTCPRCSRANPAEALFCYHDGHPLGAGPGRHNGPARQRFPMPFVFPSGRCCHSFDELALGCFDDWAAALDLVRHGALASFFAGLGRGDLAQAARAAAGAADRERALDQLLAGLPTQALAPPRLHVEPTQLNLGVLRVGQGRRWELRLTNQGLGLLHGAVTCEGGTWLALGDGPGAARKVFQFLHEQVVPVHVRGRELRAGVKPLEARLTVASSGGNVTVRVRAEVPPVPFPDGVLAGALSPRQVAEKAKAAPRQAARLFENGAVVRWYRDNGWAYPVQGPPASGLAAVQQFFEALGLTVPPKVDLADTAVRLRGQPGEPLHHVLRVVAREKRPVYASALSDEPWLSVRGVDLDGRTARVHLVVPAVPPLPGQTLRANLTVTANGRQRFVVPVTLEVSGLGLGACALGRTAVPVEVLPPLSLAELLPAEDVPRFGERPKHDEGA